MKYKNSKLNRGKICKIAYCILASQAFHAFGPFAVLWRRNSGKQSQQIWMETTQHCSDTQVLLSADMVKGAEAGKAFLMGKYGVGVYINPVESWLLLHSDGRKRNKTELLWGWLISACSFQRMIESSKNFCKESFAVCQKPSEFFISCRIHNQIHNSNIQLQNGNIFFRLASFQFLKFQGDEKLQYHPEITGLNRFFQVA